jgi:hypothetical protein
VRSKDGQTVGEAEKRDKEERVGGIEEFSQRNKETEYIRGLVCPEPEAIPLSAGVPVG